MLKLLVMLVLVMLFASCRSAAPAEAGPVDEARADLYVSPRGSDAWSGRLPCANESGTDGPFATLARARDAVRALKDRQGPVVVLVRAGVYYLAEPLSFGPEDSGTADSPVIYSAYPGEEVVLSGGRPITAWRKVEGHLWVADLPEVKSGDWYFRQLFVDGERQIRARTPNFDPDNPTTGGWAFVLPFETKGADEGAFGHRLVKIHTPGDTFQWKVNVPADGEYALWFYYGAQNEPFGNKDMGGRTTMSVDGAEPITLQNLPDTGGWRVFKWSRTATLKLSKGERRLRWKNVKGGGLDFDAFALCNDPDWKPSGTELSAPAEGASVVLVQAETYESGYGREFDVSASAPKAFRDKFRFESGDIREWPRSPEPEIHVFPAWGWVNAILSIDKIDAEAGVAYVKNRNCTQELRPGNRYFVENVFEALDSPGEWFLDKAEGRLYYWPMREPFDGRGVAGPALDRIVDLVGETGSEDEGTIGGGESEQPEEERKAGRFVEHLAFSGFTFRHTTYSLEVESVYTPADGAVHMRRARHCTIEDCRFLGVGGYAVRMSLNSEGNKILGNTILDGGQGGILLAGYETESQPRNNLIAGNTIQHCGKIWKHVAGVYVTTGSDNHIAYNTITDMPRYGISLKSFRVGSASHNNVVEYNRILRSNLETNDTGAIETLGRDHKDTNNVIRHNLILDVVGLKTSPTGEMMTPHYTWGIYLDDYSSGVHVYGNIVARTVRGGVHVHLGSNNVIENNILVDGENQQIEFNGNRNMRNNTVRNNICCYRTGAVIKVGGWHDDVLKECDNNVYWQAEGKLSESEGSVTPKGTLTDWRAAGYDNGSVVADPLFVDPANDDYSLKPDSPALKTGFKPIDTSVIGVEGYRKQEDTD